MVTERGLNRHRNCRVLEAMNRSLTPLPLLLLLLLLTMMTMMMMMTITTTTTTMLLLLSLMSQPFTRFFQVLRCILHSRR